MSRRPKSYDYPDRKEGVVTDVVRFMIHQVMRGWLFLIRCFLCIRACLKSNSEIIIAIFTVVLAIIAGMQLDALNRTDQNIAKQDKTARLRDRAFVYFNDPGVREWPPKPSNPDRWAISIKIENLGNVPARSVKIRHACPTAIAPNKITDPFKEAIWKATPLPTVIGPKQDFAAQGCEFLTAEIEEAKSGKRDIFIVMETTYWPAPGLVDTHLS